MTERDFCYWLRGYFEMTELQWYRSNSDTSFDTNVNALNADQVSLIKEHLARVFGEQNSPAEKWKIDPTIKTHLTC